MDFGLFLHRCWVVFAVPFVWVAATAAYLVLSPLHAGEQVWLGIKRHWNDR